MSSMHINQITANGYLVIIREDYLDYRTFNPVTGGFFKLSEIIWNGNACRREEIPRLEEISAIQSVGSWKLSSRGRHPLYPAAGSGRQTETQAGFKEHPMAKWGFQRICGLCRNRRIFKCSYKSGYNRFKIPDCIHVFRSSVVAMSPGDHFRLFKSLRVDSHAYYETKQCRWTPVHLSIPVKAILVMMGKQNIFTELRITPRYVVVPSNNSWSRFSLYTAWLTGS